MDDYSNDRYVTCDRGHTHWGSGGAAGLMLHHQDENGVHRYLMQQRSSWVQHGETWAPASGALDPGEHPIQGALREAYEEYGGQFPSNNHEIAHVNDHGGWKFHTVTADSPTMFDPKESDEVADAAWLTPEEIDELPLHPGFSESWVDLRPNDQRRTFSSHPRSRSMEGRSRERDDHQPSAEISEASYRSARQGWVFGGVSELPRDTANRTSTSGDLDSAIWCYPGGDDDSSHQQHKNGQSYLEPRSQDIWGEFSTGVHGRQARSAIRSDVQEETWSSDERREGQWDDMPVHSGEVRDLGISSGQNNRQNNPFAEAIVTERDSSDQIGSRSGNVIYRSSTQMGHIEESSLPPGSRVISKEDSSPDEPDADAQVLDGLTMRSVAHNLHYKYEQAPLTAQEASEYAARLLDMIGYHNPDELTISTALNAWHQLYPNDNQLTQGPEIQSQLNHLESTPPQQDEAQPTVPTESWGYGTTSATLPFDPYSHVVEQLGLKKAPNGPGWVDDNGARLHALNLSHHPEANALTINNIQCIPEGMGLGSRVVESLQDYADQNDLSLEANEVSNDHFWSKYPDVQWVNRGQTNVIPRETTSAWKFASPTPPQKPLYHWTDASDLGGWMDESHTGPGETYLTEHGDAPDDESWNPEIPMMSNPVRLTIDHTQLDPENWDPQYHGYLNNYLYKGAIPKSAISEVKSFPPADSWEMPEHWGSVKEAIGDPSVLSSWFPSEDPQGLLDSDLGETIPPDQEDQRLRQVEAEPTPLTPSTQAVVNNAGQIPGDENYMGDFTDWKENPLRGINPSYTAYTWPKDDSPARPVYVKPEGDFHANDLAHERAAFGLAQQMGVPMPHTVVRRVPNPAFAGTDEATRRYLNPTVPASVQQTVSGEALSKTHRPWQAARDFPEDARRIALFDHVIGNHDRHMGNIMRDENDQLIPIDHGGAFMEPDVYAPDYLGGREGFGGVPLTEEEEGMLGRAYDHPLEQYGLPAHEIDGVKTRIQEMLARGTHLGFGGNPPVEDSGPGTGEYRQMGWDDDQWQNAAGKAQDFMNEEGVSGDHNLVHDLAAELRGRGHEWPEAYQSALDNYYHNYLGADGAPNIRDHLLQ
jgi:8-oxo-dGTP diphosphatase